MTIGGTGETRSHNPAPTTGENQGGLDPSVLNKIAANLNIQVSSLSTEEGNVLLQISGNFGDSFIVALADPNIDPAQVQALIEDALNKVTSDIGTLAAEAKNAQSALEKNDYMGQILAIMKLIMAMTQEQEMQLMSMANEASMSSYEHTMKAIDKEVGAALTRLIATSVSSGLTIAFGVGQMGAAANIKPNASFGGKNALAGQAMGQVGQALSKLIDSIGAYEAAKQEGEAGELRALAKLDDDMKEQTQKAAKAMNEAFDEALKVLESIWRSSTQAANDVTNMA